MVLVPEEDPVENIQVHQVHPDLLILIAAVQIQVLPTQGLREEAEIIPVLLLPVVHIALRIRVAVLIDLLIQAAVLPVLPVPVVLQEVPAAEDSGYVKLYKTTLNPAFSTASMSVGLSKPLPFISADFFSSET